MPKTLASSINDGHKRENITLDITMLASTGQMSRKAIMYG